jgi:hypothetical protein
VCKCGLRVQGVLEEFREFWKSPGSSGRVQGVLEEFREIPVVKFRGVSDYNFTFTKSIKFLCGVIYLSSSHARTHTHTHTHTHIVYYWSYIPSPFRCFYLKALILTKFNKPSPQLTTTIIQNSRVFVTATVWYGSDSGLQSYRTVCEKPTPITADS